MDRLRLFSQLGVRATEIGEAGVERACAERRMK